MHHVAIVKRNLVLDIVFKRLIGNCKTKEIPSVWVASKPIEVAYEYKLWREDEIISVFHIRGQSV